MQLLNYHMTDSPAVHGGPEDYANLAGVALICT